MKHALRHSFFCMLSFFLMNSPAVAQNAPTIDLRLFGKQDVTGGQGCFFALWQQNRNPAKDKFAYVFYVRFYDAHPMPALVKIGKTLHELEKVEVGVPSSTVLDKFQFYQSADKNTRVLVELEGLKTRGDVTDVTKGKLTFVVADKAPFVISVKGQSGCESNGSNSASADAAQPARKAAAPVAPVVPKGTARPTNYDSAGIELSRGVNFNSLSQVPDPVRKLAAEQGEACDVKNTPRAGTRYAITDAMTLWEMPCALYASNASVVYITALNGSPYANLLEIPGAPGEESGEPAYDIMNAVFYPKNGLMTSIETNAAGNCGSFFRYQLILSDGESLEFKLLEERRKKDCTGRLMSPEKFPIMFRAPKR